MGIIKNAINEKNPDLLCCEKVEDSFIDDFADALYQSVARAIVEKVKSKTMPEIGYYCLSRHFYTVKSNTYDEVQDEEGEDLMFIHFLGVYSMPNNGKNHEYYLPLYNDFFINHEDVGVGFLKSSLKCTVSYVPIIMDIMKRLINLLKTEEGIECFPLINYDPEASEKIEGNYKYFDIEETGERFVENNGSITIPSTKRVKDVCFGPAIKIIYK